MILRQRSKPPARTGQMILTTPTKKVKKSVKLPQFVRSFPQHLRKKKLQWSPKRTTALSKSAFVTNTETS